MKVFENHGQDSRYRDMGEVCETVSAKYGTGGGNQPLVAYGLHPFIANANTDKPHHGPGDGFKKEQAFTLASMGVPKVAKCIAMSGGNDRVVGTLTSCDLVKMPNNEGVSGGLYAIQGNVIGRTEKNGPQGPGYEADGKCFTLTTADRHAVADEMAVRRLTPVECERLQGMPSIVEIKGGDMTRDEAIVMAIINKDILVNTERGEIYRTRGPGGIRLKEPELIRGSILRGYKNFSLHQGGVHWQIRHHRAIWIAANGIPKEGMVVDHINNDKTDNRLANLQLLTAGENSTKARKDGLYLVGDEHPRAKLTVELRQKIVHDYFDGKGSYCDLANKYGISKARVHQLVKETGYTQIPYRGKPAEQCPNSPRYKAIGNSWAVPVVRWIGNRIDKALKGEEL